MSMASATRRAGLIAEIWRQDEGVDRFGQPSGLFEPIEEYPCRLSFAGINASNYRSGEIMTERYVDVVGETRITFINGDADVSEKDQLRIKNKAGDEVMPLTNIYSVRPRYDGRGRIHHTEIVTITVRESEFQHAGASS